MCAYELNYDPAKLREVLRTSAERRGVRVSACVIAAGTRIGTYKRQGEKRSEKAEGRRLKEVDGEKGGQHAV